MFIIDAQEILLPVEPSQSDLSIFWVMSVFENTELYLDLYLNSFLDVLFYKEK